MKPRLRKINGLWYCWTRLIAAQCGVGYDPQMAYVDWQSRTAS